MQTEWTKLDLVVIDPATGEPTEAWLRLEVDPWNRAVLTYEIRHRRNDDSWAPGAE